MKTVTIDHKNGHKTTYKVLPSGTAYHLDTPEEVCNILENARIKRSRVKLYLGDTKTGRDWMEEHDTCGTIGRSFGGMVNIPLLINTSRSLGGGGIMDNYIVKIKVDGRVVYQHKNYNRRDIEIVPSDMEGYTHNVVIGGEVYSLHKSERSAKLLVNKLS